MSFYTQSWDEYAEAEWRRMGRPSKESWLKLGDLPTSESELDFDHLRPQVKQAFVEDCVDHVKGDLEKRDWQYLDVDIDER